MKTEVPAGIVCIAPWNWAGGGPCSPSSKKRSRSSISVPGSNATRKNSRSRSSAFRNSIVCSPAEIIRNVVTSVIRNDDGVGIGQRGTGVTAQLEGLEHPELHMGDSLGVGMKHRKT